MRKTYAHNSIIIGFLVGALVYAKAGMGAGIAVGIIVTVVGWLIIRGIENAMYSGADAIDNAIRRKQSEKYSTDDEESEDIDDLDEEDDDPYSLNPEPEESEEDPAVNRRKDSWICPKCESENSNDTLICKDCGKQIWLCPHCGSANSFHKTACSECGWQA